MQPAMIHSSRISNAQRGAMRAHVNLAGDGGGM
jgi:hypothetical protein